VTDEEFAGALLTILDELLDGSTREASGVLNPDDPGLLESIAKLSAEAASARPTGGGASIAAHVDHLSYGLNLLNRWSRGEEPFATADYSASWQRTSVSEPEWASRQEILRREAYTWREAIARRSQFSKTEATLLLASVAHLAYHLGAMRQINRSIGGPPAQD
jgi:hypothetical protein